MGVSKIFLLFILIVSASTKNVVLIGDSRTVGIAVYLMGFDYTTKTAYYGNGSNIVGLTPRIYGSYSVKAICETGASYNTFTSKAILSSGVHSALAGSSAGTIVLMWLGVNGLNSEGTFNYYKSLATKYSKLKFYAISITGVDASKSNISNNSIKTFNTDLSKNIKNAGLSNLKYKSILYNNDPTKIGTNKVSLAISSSTTDVYGLHYFTSGYKIIFDTMVSGI